MKQQTHRQYLDGSGLDEVPPLKCWQKLVHVTPDVVERAARGDTSERHERRDVRTTSRRVTDLPTAPWAPMASAANSCYGKKQQRQVWRIVWLQSINNIQRLNKEPNQDLSADDPDDCPGQHLLEGILDLCGTLDLWVRILDLCVCNSWFVCT